MAKTEQGECYFLVRPREDGGVFMSQCGLADLLEEIESEEQEIEFLGKVPDDWAYVESHRALVIKGRIVVPRPKQVVQTYEVD